MNFKDITLADVSVETKVETLGIALDFKVKELEQSVSSVSQQIGPVGPKGDKGDRGPSGADGKPGRDGLNGSDGKAGVNGTDGEDGKDGVSVVDAVIAADNSLVFTLSDGSEIDAGFIGGTAGEVSYVNVGKATKVINNSGSGSTTAINPVFHYTDGVLTSITYSGGESKVFTYAAGLLVQLDFIQGAITERKTFTYTDGVLSSITQVTI